MLGILWCFVLLPGDAASQSFTELEPLELYSFNVSDAFTQEFVMKVSATDRPITYEFTFYGVYKNLGMRDWKSATLRVTRSRSSTSLTAEDTFGLQNFGCRHTVYDGIHAAEHVLRLEESGFVSFFDGELRERRCNFLDSYAGMKRIGRVDVHMYSSSPQGAVGIGVSFAIMTRACRADVFDQFSRGFKYAEYPRVKNPLEAVPSGGAVNFTCEYGQLTGSGPVLCDKGALSYERRPECFIACTSLIEGLYQESTEPIWHMQAESFSFPWERRSFSMEGGQYGTVSCDDGYFQMASTDRLYCGMTGQLGGTTIDGKGIGEIPYCRLGCSADRFAQDRPGMIVSWERVKPGDSLAVSCEKKYELVGPSYIKCIKGDESGNDEFDGAPICKGRLGKTNTILIIIVAIVAVIGLIYCLCRIVPYCQTRYEPVEYDNHPHGRAEQETELGPQRGDHHDPSFHGDTTPVEPSAPPTSYHSTPTQLGVESNKYNPTMDTQMEEAGNFSGMDLGGGEDIETLPPPPSYDDLEYYQPTNT